MFIKKASLALMLSASLLIQSIPGISSASSDSSLLYKNNFINEAYAISTASTTTNPELIYGDLNNDGRVDAGDFTSLRKFLLKLSSEFKNPQWRTAADLNLDNTIDSADYTLLRSYLLKKIKSIPVGSITQPTSIPPTNTPLPTNTPIIIEAEDMVLTNYSINSSSVASGGKYIETSQTDSGPASAKYTSDFNGYYDINITYFDENDGTSTCVISNENASSPTFSYDWYANKNLGSSVVSEESKTIKKFIKVFIQGKSTIILETYAGGNENLCIDKIEFIPCSEQIMPKEDIKITVPYNGSLEVSSEGHPHQLFQTYINPDVFKDVAKVEYNIGGSIYEGKSTSPYEFYYDSDYLPYGSTIDVFVTATNTSGDKIESKTYTYGVHWATITARPPSPSPKIEIISPSTYGGTATICSTSEVFESQIYNFSNIVKVEYLINNETILADTHPPYRCVYNEIPIPSSENNVNSLSVIVTATNDMGQKLISKKYCYTLRKPTPTITPTSASDQIEVCGSNGITSQYTSFEAKINDVNFSNITKMEYIINNETVSGDIFQPYRCVYNNVPVLSSPLDHSSLKVCAIATNDTGEKLVSKDYYFTLSCPTPTITPIPIPVP